MSGPFLYYSEILLRILPERDYAVHLEALAESLPLEVVATDVRGRVVVWNAALARVGGPREEALGRPLLEAAPWLAEDRNTDWGELLAGALAGEKARTLARHPLGRRVVRATMAPMVGSGSEILGAVLCLEDITRLAREEEQRRIQARSDAVTALGAGIAHEVRNPLNALSLNLQLLRERLEDPAATRADLTAKTDAMIAEVARMETLIQNLLAVSRGGAPVTADEHLDRIVEGIVRRVVDDAEARGVDVLFRGGSTRTLPLERMRIESAVENIVQNAIDAAAESGGRGYVWITTRDDPHSSVVMVEDDGPGIRPEDRPRVFELFFTRKRGGTGLGLPLARRAVESHGGELEVLERPGGGARFVIHLPVRTGGDVRDAGGGEA